MSKKKFDFGGWATRSNILCSDGVTIAPDSFAHQDGSKVPLVWNHEHNRPENVLGYAILHSVDGDMYADCAFNDTDAGKAAKLLVQHGDIVALSIYANKLKKQGSLVKHGMIREVSLVLAGANPGALIDYSLEHGEYSEESAEIFHGEEGIDMPEDFEDEENIEHGDDEEEIEHAGEEEPTAEGEEGEEKMGESNNDERTIQDIFDTMNEDQKNVVYAMVGMALDNKESEDNNMKHNAFEGNEMEEEVLSQSEITEIIKDANRYGSLKESVLQHGITNIDYLFPENQMVGEPATYAREMDWVQVVMKGVKRSPFARIKSAYFNLTADQARALGYVKGDEKVDEVIVALKRTTNPCTIYKHQSIDRDDYIDITDFDVVAYLKKEMRMMLDEEIARAILVGDGRNAATDDNKISESCIRPIWTDDDTYTVKAAYTLGASYTDDQRAKAFIRTAIKSRKNYKGSGNPVCFMTEDMLTNCLLMEDTQGRVIYDTEEKLRTALRCSKIVTVPVMENQVRTATESGTQYDYELDAIFVNLSDYNVGADKGGAVSMFDDFDIDYNKMKYLIETRCSGALIKPYSAVAVEFKAAHSA